MRPLTVPKRPRSQCDYCDPEWLGGPPRCCNDLSLRIRTDHTVRHVGTGGWCKRRVGLKCRRGERRAYWLAAGDAVSLSHARHEQRRHNAWRRSSVRHNHLGNGNNSERGRDEQSAYCGLLHFCDVFLRRRPSCTKTSTMPTATETSDHVVTAAGYWNGTKWTRQTTPNDLALAKIS